MKSVGGLLIQKFFSEMGDKITDQRLMWQWTKVYWQVLDISQNKNNKLNMSKMFFL